MDLSGSV